MDFIGPFPKSHEFNYLWVVICRLTSMVPAPSVDFSIVHGTTCLENSPSLMGQRMPADIYH